MANHNRRSNVYVLMGIMVNLDTAASVIIPAGTVGLLILGGVLAYQEKTTNAGLVLGIAVFFAFFMICARFKHFEGAGFKAEMWDEKQVEAAQLIDRLSLLSEATAQQTGIIASRLGLWGSGLTNPQLAQLLNQTEQVLVAAGTPKAKRDELAAPVIERIKLNYQNAAQALSEKAYKAVIEDLEHKNLQAKEEDRPPLQEKLHQFYVLRTRLTEISKKQILEANSLDPIITLVQSSPPFDDKDRLLNNLAEFNDDFLFFAANLQLKRSIDLDYIYQP